jgi:hypothetical protein
MLRMTRDEFSKIEQCKCELPIAATTVFDADKVREHTQKEIKNMSTGRAIQLMSSGNMLGSVCNACFCRW